MAVVEEESAAGKGAAEDSDSELVEETFGDLSMKSAGTLLPPPVRASSGRGKLVSILVEKIGLKDATKYYEPYVTVSLVDGNGATIGRPQDTPASNRRRGPFYIVFGCTAHLQTMLEDIPKNSAIFFEFKHFKPKKKYVSTRCWAFLELDEINPEGGGELVLELYKKPTDPKRKKIRLLSIKPLYLHLRIQIT